MTHDPNAAIDLDVVLADPAEPIHLTIFPATKSWGGEAHARMTRDQARALGQELIAAADDPVGYRPGVASA